MITAGTIYWFIVIGNISSVCTIFLVILTLALIIAVIFYVMITFDGYGPDKDKDMIRSIIVKILISWSILLILSIFTPSTKDIAAIYLMPKIVNNEHVKNLPDKTLTILEKKLDEWIKDQTEEKKK
jgi:hypothetical protein